jgi:predicted Zn-dependent protease
MRLDEVRRARRALTDVDKDPLALTLDEERRVGRAVHDLILQQHRKMVPGALQRRVQDAALPLLGLRQRKDLDYHFILLDSDNVNAFSHPGGYVYINRGVFDLIADDAELQFVLAHEMAHVDLKHAAKEVARSLRGAPIGGPDDPGLVQRFYHQVAQGYTEDEEIEADARAYRQLIELGRTPRESLSFARRFLGYVERNGLEAGGHKPATDLDAEVQDVENHWPSHPSAMDRVDRLQLLRGKPQHQ